MVCVYIECPPILSFHFSPLTPLFSLHLSAPWSPLISLCSLPYLPLSPPLSLSVPSLISLSPSPDPIPSESTLSYIPFNFSFHSPSLSPNDKTYGAGDVYHTGLLIVKRKDPGAEAQPL